MIGKLFIAILRARIDDDGSGIENFFPELIHLQNQLESLRKRDFGDIEGEALFLQTLVKDKIHPGEFGKNIESIFNIGVLEFERNRPGGSNIEFHAIDDGTRSAFDFFKED